MSVTNDVDDAESTTISTKAQSENDKREAPANLVPSQKRRQSVLSRPFGIKAKGWVWMIVILVLLLIFTLLARNAYKRGQQSKQVKVGQLISRNYHKKHVVDCS